MTTITIQNIIDLNNSRDAQRILRAAIIKGTVVDGRDDLADRWSRIIAAAKDAVIVNTDHPNARQMKSVSQSQILDRMGTDALTIFLDDMETDGSQVALDRLEEAFLNGGNNPMTFWPYANEDGSQTQRINWNRARSHDISHLLNEDAPEPQAEPQEASTYDVGHDIAAAANTLLRAATGGEMDDLQALLDEVVTLRNKPAPTPIAAPVQASGDIPAGEPTTRNAQDVFGMKHNLLDFDVTCYDWDGVNPLVPVKDDDYIFNVSNLADALWSLETNSNAWLTGHTGTGKSTFAAQVCAYTGRMMTRVNMDSGIERPDFVGSVEVTTDDDGVQVTRFKDGVLPKAMQMPCLLLLDEYDAVRPDISYVMQPVLEGGVLRLLEDGGRIVHPHEGFRIMATANTVGAGDSSGMYASAVKVQSRASINRFSSFIKVDYLPVCDEMKIVRKYAPSTSDNAMALIENFVSHYREGFLDGTIATPISPRNTVTIGKYVDSFERRIGSEEAVKRALEMNVMMTVDEGDMIAVKGIMDRITQG